MLGEETTPTSEGDFTMTGGIFFSFFDLPFKKGYRFSDRVIIQIC